MAQTVILTDDLDGSADAETIRFALKGQNYEIDLSAKNVERLEKALQPFIEKARKAGGAARAPRGTGTSAGPKVDYTAKENFGVLHRGKVTDEEAKLVRENLEQAQANRKAAGQPAIDPNGEGDKKRYGF